MQGRHSCHQAHRNTVVIRHIGTEKRTEKAPTVISNLEIGKVRTIKRKESRRDRRVGLSGRMVHCSGTGQGDSVRCLRRGKRNSHLGDWQSELRGARWPQGMRGLL